MTPLKANPLDPTTLSLRDDEEAVMRAFLNGASLEADIVARVQERSRRVREEIFQRHGLVDIAVPAIRELRGPLP